MGIWLIFLRRVNGRGCASPRAFKMALGIGVTSPPCTPSLVEADDAMAARNTLDRHRDHPSHSPEYSTVRLQCTAALATTSHEAPITIPHATLTARLQSSIRVFDSKGCVRAAISQSAPFLKVQRGKIPQKLVQ